MKTLFIASVFALVFSTGVFAVDVPLFPTQFFGSLTVNNVSSPAGTELVARIFNQQKGNFTTTVAGQYGGAGGFDPKLVVNPGNVSDTISFFVKKPSMNGFVAAQQTASYDQGIHQLSLAAQSVCGDTVCDTELESCSSCASDCGACPPSGGGSGGSGGGTGGSSGGGSGGSGGSGTGGSSAGTGNAANMSLNGTCVDNWECSPFSPCIQGYQTRTCSDNSSCGNETAPVTTQLCAAEPGAPSSASGLCEPGFKLCVGNEVFLCTENSSWVTFEACTGACSNGACVSPAATPAPSAPQQPGPLSDLLTGRFLGQAGAKEMGVLAIVVVAILILLVKIVLL